MFGFLKKLFPSKKDKDLRDLQPIVAEINAEYEKLHNLSDDELRGKTDQFKERIQEYISEIASDIEAKKLEAEQEEDVSQKESLYEDLDKLNKERNSAIEEILNELLPQAFAVVKETARRLTENRTLKVKATEYDKFLAARALKRAQDYVSKRADIQNKEAKIKELTNVVIDGEHAIWSNKWVAAGNEVDWFMIHYDVQLIGGTVLHQGKIAEMATGEGKTLVATLPIYLNALAGLGLHLVTVNPYLAQRDAEWNAPLFQFHGFTVDCIDLHKPNTDARRKAYLADITYGTNNEFGFDYLRDNMTTHPEFLVQRAHHFAIIDEIDSVLIDEARTPLIISGPVPHGDKQEFESLKPRVERIYRRQRDLVNKLLREAKRSIAGGDKETGGLALYRAHRGLPRTRTLISYLGEPGVKSVMDKTEGFYMQDNQKNMHLVDEELYFRIDEKNNQIELTDKGRESLGATEEDKNFFMLPDVASLFADLDTNTEISDEYRLEQKSLIAKEFAEKSERLHAINQLLKAYALFEKEKDYIVQEGKVMIVDEQTGRALPGRRYSDGLHQAIEAKENVKVEAATQTFATVTLQNYFRMYHKLGGMTGTAETEEAEFFDIYKLDVVVIPTNRPIVRVDSEDLVYKTKREKYNAVIDEIEDLRAAGRPVLVGTTSVEVSELLARMLRMREIPHNVLNAKYHQREAEIVAEAGKMGAVTVATNMAGRGTDIKISEEVKRAGGLAIIGTERHESRRIDRQLRGRAGRQGDPGSSQFFVSLEDDLMRLFGSERISRVMDRIGIQEGEVIQHSMITKSISNAQRKVEQNNFSMRKRLLEYDDVMNSQREVIYKRRRNALYGDRIKIDLNNMLFDMCSSVVEEYYQLLDVEGLKLTCLQLFAIDPEVTAADINDLSSDEIAESVYQKAQDSFKRKADRLSQVIYNGIVNIKQNNPAVERILVPFSDGNKRLELIITVEDAINSQGTAVVDQLEKAIALSTIDTNWKHHLRDMDDLRQSVQMAVFEQKDPLLIYKFESYQLFQEVLKKVNTEVLETLFNADLNVEQQKKPSTTESKPKRDDFSKYKTGNKQIEDLKRKRMQNERKTMANTGSGEESERRLSRRERRAQERKQKRPPRPQPKKTRRR